jgi:hypothetical protein
MYSEDGKTIKIRKAGLKMQAIDTKRMLIIGAGKEKWL